MRPGHPAGQEGPYFFLAYAHTPERPWVARLFRDICREVMERTTWPVNVPIGFMDDDAIPLGGDWRDEVARALATCQVFVPLYSPRYFTREECGREWHAFAQRLIDHRAHHPENPSAIVPVLWTPVDADDIPETARLIQVNHADLGTEYAEEGFYTLIKNSLYRKEYVTAVQRLAKHIIQAAGTARLHPCEVADLGQPRNAFETPGKETPGDRRLTMVIAAPTVDRLPAGRSDTFYGPTSREWNPFYPCTRQTIGEYAAAVARLHSFDATVLPFEDGYSLLVNADPADGLGLLLIDAWASLDEHLAEQLRELDSLNLEWVGVMVPWNVEDEQTRQHADELRRALQAVLPNHLGAGRTFTPGVSAKIGTLQQFRTNLPEVMEAALFRYLNRVDAHPPAGDIPRRPRLGGLEEQAG